MITHRLNKAVRILKDIIAVLYTIGHMCLIGSSTRASASRAPSGGARPRRGKIPDRQVMYIR